MERTPLLSSSLLVYVYFFLKDNQQVRTVPLPPVIHVGCYMQARLCFKGQSFCLSVRLQLILQLIMRQPCWLIRSKQRAFNPIHVAWVFFSSMSSLSNTIRCRMQSREEAGAGHTCLAGLQAGSWEARSQRNSWLHRWWSWEDLGESHSLAPAQRREGALWGMQAEKHFLG